MLKNAYLDAKFGFDTAENEPFEVCPIEPQLAGSGRMLAQTFRLLRLGREWRFDQATGHAGAAAYFVSETHELC